MKLVKIPIMAAICVGLFSSCGEVDDAKVAPDGKSTQEAAAEVEVTHFFEAKITGGKFDGQTLRGEKVDKNGLAMLAGNRKDDTLFSINLIKMVTPDASGTVYSGTLDALFVGPVAVGKVATRYSQDGTKENGDIGELELRPAEGDSFSTYQLQFKEADLEITSISDWVIKESKYSGKSRKRDVGMKMTVSEARVNDQPVGSQGEILPFDGKLEITLITQQSEKIE